MQVLVIVYMYFQLIWARNILNLYEDLRSTYTCIVYIVCTMIFIDTILHSYVTNNSLDTVAKDMEAVWNCYRFESIHNRIYSIYITYMVLQTILYSDLCFSCWAGGEFLCFVRVEYSLDERVGKYIVWNTWEYIFSYGSSKESVRKLRILLSRTAKTIAMTIQKIKCNRQELR